MKKPATVTKASGRRARPALGTGGRTLADAASRYAAGIGYTGMKHLLACVDGTQNDRCVLDYAFRIALRFGAHIDVLHVRFDSRGTTAKKRRAGIADRLLAQPVEKHVSEAAAHARHHFEEWQAQCRLPVLDSGIAAPRPSIQWREILGYESEVIARLG